MMRPMTRVLRVLVIGALLAACGGSDTKTVSAAAWAGDVCGELLSWQERVQSLGSNLESRVADVGDDLAAARVELVEFLDGMVERTERTIGRIDDAGVPDVPQGEEAADDFKSGMEQVNRAFLSARDRVETLPVDDPSAFQEGAERLGEELEAAGDQVGRRFDDLDHSDDPALQTAFREAPACQEVSSGGGVPVDAWAGEICGHLVSWQDRIEALTAGLDSTMEAVAGDLPAIRDRLSGFLGEVITATDQMIRSVEEAGTPDIDEGEQVAEDLRSGLGQVRQVFVAGQVNAQNLSVDDPEAFQAGAEEIGSQIERAGDEIQRQFEELDQEYDLPELDEAFTRADACQELDAG